MIQLLRKRAPRETRNALTTFCGMNSSPAALASAAARLEAFLATAELRPHEVRRVVQKVYFFEWQGMRLVWKSGPESAAREVAAYHLDRLLGHTCRVLPVVLKDEGSLSVYVENSQPSHLDPRGPYILQNPERSEYYRIALLDCLIGNRDRHAGNWLITRAGVSIPIDHALAFPSRNGLQRFRAYDFAIPVALREEDRQRLSSLQDRLHPTLVGLLGEEPVQALLERVQQVLAEGRTYDWHGGNGRPPGHFQDTVQVRFGEMTRLDVSDIVLSDGDGYSTLLDHIEVHRYYLGMEQSREVSREEAAASWKEHVYLPVLASVREASLQKEFPRRTEAELYLWVTYHRERMGKRADMEVARILTEKFSERPWRRVWMALKRMWAAAWETPEPPPAPIEV